MISFWGTIIDYTNLEYPTNNNYFMKSSGICNLFEIGIFSKLFGGRFWLVNLDGYGNFGENSNG